MGSIEAEAVYRKLVLGKKFRVYGTLENPLFLAKEVAEWIDNPNPSQMVRTVDDEEKLIYTIRMSGQNRECLFLTEKGLVQLLSKTRTISNNKKHEIVSELQKLGFLKEFKFTAPKEIEFISLLEDVLKPFNVTGEKQFFHKGRHIDYYIPSLKIAIEYDENDHKGYTYENQEGRQKMLENELGCRFIRLSDKNSNGYNIGLVMKMIFGFKEVNPVCSYASESVISVIKAKPRLKLC